MYIQILGTAGMVPTKERSHSATLFYHEKGSILFDCGEGTQRQMKIAGVDMNRISRIFITHWHGDHVLGLPGLLQTLASQGYAETINIYGPPGSKKHFRSMLDAFDFDRKIDVEVHEVKDGVVYEGEAYTIEAKKLDHSVPTYGYRFIEADRRKMKLDFVKKRNIPQGPLWGKLQRGEDITFKGEKIKADDATSIVKGNIISYVMDTAYCTNAVELSKNTDIMISEAMFLSEIEDKAEGYQHLTAKQAALIAQQAGAKKLVLTHFSQRYKTTQELDEEVKTYFPDAVCAYDLMKIKL